MDRHFQSLYKYQLFLFVISMFALTAALGWNDAIQSAFRNLVPHDQSQLIHIKFAYALIVTLILMGVLYLLYVSLGI